MASTHPHTILVATSDDAFWRAVSKQLMGHGYVVECLRPSGNHISPPTLGGIALLLADRRLSGLDPLRHSANELGIPFVTVQPPGIPGCNNDCLDDLEQGAAMAICTNSYRELGARVRALLRREQFHTLGQSRLETGTIRMDLDRHEVTVRGRPVDLTMKEFQILRQLLESPEKVFTRQELLNRVWGEEFALEEHTLDVHIYSLRQKIETDPAHPRCILTVRGIGYKLQGEQGDRNQRGRAR